MATLKKHERPSQEHERKQVKQIWRKKTYYSHCNINGHQRATCWRLHPEQRLKDKALVHELGETIVQQANPPQGDDPFTTISEKWFLDMLACHGHAFVNYLLHFKM